MLPPLAKEQYDKSTIHSHRIHHQRTLPTLVCIKTCHAVEPFHEYISFSLVSMRVPRQTRNNLDSHRVPLTDYQSISIRLVDTRGQGGKED